MKIVYIDMDGVLADFEKGIGRPGHEWDAPEMFVPGFFRRLEVLPGAKEAVGKLLTFSQLDVYIATKPTTKALGCATEKFQWIEEHFPDLLRKMFITCDKGHLNGDYLIDDDISAWGQKFKGTFVHFDQFNSEEAWKKIVEYMERYK